MILELISTDSHAKQLYHLQRPQSLNGPEKSDE
jgi:hypothetical protein